MEYPLKLTVEGEVVMALRKDEVKINESGKFTLEVGDAMERAFWEMSNKTLERISEESRDKKDRLSFRIRESIERILSQRRFLQNNKSFRKSLLPED